ncbi:MAG: type II secretion system GspH family protein [Actinobacteria bacterium]|nr:type II secretion system GspH family protein [Actinomycetota bacterium]MCA1719583.1 type II secretion system GspH family protein [Actinomycetota bacterium]
MNAKNETGETLVEVLLAVAILGIAVVVLLSGLGTAIASSSLHRDFSNSQLEVRSFAEAVKKAAYVPCTAGVAFVPGTTVPPAAYSSPPGYTASSSYPASVDKVQYWTGSAFAGTCPAGGDLGVQLVTVTTQGSNGRGSQTLAVAKRKPCGVLDALC